MKPLRLILIITSMLLGFTQVAFSQIGSVKTESYQASFEKTQSIDSVSNYTDTIQIPIQLLKIGINAELYELYPELKDKRVGLGVTNIVIEYLEMTGRFIFTEEKEDIKQRMIAQDKASDKGVSSNKIDVKGNVVLAKYFVLALAPYNNGNNETTNVSIIESLTSDSSDSNSNSNSNNNSNNNSKNWISFWQVPSSTTLPVYGPKPLNIGNNVQQYKF